MCGIVCYFGGAGNALTRILTGMAAIAYRAPDSTGIGVAGNDRQPILTRKTVGALPHLVESLCDREVYPNLDEAAFRFRLADDSDEFIRDCQRELLRREGFCVEPAAESDRDEAAPPSYDALVELAPHAVCHLSPGRAGSPSSRPVYRVRNRPQLKQLFETWIDRYDLSPLVTKTIIEDALRKHYPRAAAHIPIPVPLPDLLAAFQQVFDRFDWDSEEAFRSPQQRQRTAFDRLSRKHLWRLLMKTPIPLPADYDRDGVRCLFRLLDAVLLTQAAIFPDLPEQLEKRQNRLFSTKESQPRLPWRELYRAEKSLHVYGIAAATAYHHLKETVVHPDALPEEARRLPAGTTDPRTLRHLSAPIIGHGRWALQSAVTARNAHPFLDDSGTRAVVLNGQFSVATENRIRGFLKNAGLKLRTDNSGEYVSLLWGHYYQALLNGQEHSRFIQREVDAGLDDLCLGSETLDYRLFQQVRDRSLLELDEMAFREAARKIVAEGGQVAIAALSIHSPQRLYVACHNRSAFIVQRLDNQDLMVVSDINAAMGLFPQILIRDRSRALRALERRRKQMKSDQEGAATGTDAAMAEDHYRRERERLLEAFRVRVLPLDGEQWMARLEVSGYRSEVIRRVTVTDFDGRPLPPMETFETLLDPLETRREAFRSFYEMHLAEIPDRLRNAWQTAAPLDSAGPLLSLREKVITRRFGRNLDNLCRVILLGMGNSYRVALMARTAFQRMLPQVQCLALRPVEIDQIPWSFDSDRDLALLLSVSGTSGDMVELARDLDRHRVAAIGITEKPFSDMALSTGKNAGTVPILCGEEVTYSAVKSPACQLLATHLVLAWLVQRSRPHPSPRELQAWLEPLAQVPDVVDQVLSDPEIRAFAQRFAESFPAAASVLVIDWPDDGGTGREAASKLEDASWNAAAKTIDARHLPLDLLAAQRHHCRVLVNATRADRLDEALHVMRRLRDADIAFWAVACENEQGREMVRLSKDQAGFLPRMEVSLQPFVDLTFYGLLAGICGPALGRTEPGFPRNRAKSVAASRSRTKPPVEAPDPLLLEHLENLPSSELNLQDPGTSYWQQQAGSEEERAYYRGMLHLGTCLGQKNVWQRLVSLPSSPPLPLLERLGEALFEPGDLIVAACDRPSLAVARDAVAFWSRRTKATLAAVPIEHLTAQAVSEAVLVVLGTGDPAPVSAKLVELGHSEALSVWLGPEPVTAAAARFSPQAHSCRISEAWQVNTPEALHATLHLLLLKAVQHRRPERAAQHLSVLRLAPLVVKTIENDRTLHRRILDTAAHNRTYRSASFLSGCRGTGLAWTEWFDRSGALALEGYLYGEGAYGPIVTVDPDPLRKYVTLRRRAEMEREYGKTLVDQWQQRFMGGRAIDDFLAAPGGLNMADPYRPFPVEEGWILPVLRPGYSPLGDNLIFVDAADPGHISRAMDALSVYGARFARMVLIVQQPGGSRKLPDGLLQYPLAGVLELPRLSLVGTEYGIPELLLPLAMNLVAACISARKLWRES